MCACQAQTILKACEELPSGTNPVEGLTKLQIIINRAKSPDNIILVLEQLLDWRLAGLLTSPPSVSDFVGNRPGASGKGLVEIILAKWEVSKHVLRNSPAGLDAEVIVQMKRTFATIATYRETIGYPNERKDLTWRASWGKSSSAYFLFIEQILYGTTWDCAIKDGIKSGFSAADMVKQGSKQGIDQ